MQAIAIDLNIAALDAKGLQAAVAAELWRSRREDAARGIDESQSIDGEAVRIRDDDLGALAGDLDVAVELTAAGAHHFVEDDPGAAVGQIRVAIDITAK